MTHDEIMAEDERTRAYWHAAWRQRSAEYWRKLAETELSPEEREYRERILRLSDAHQSDVAEGIADRQLYRRMQAWERNQ